MNASRFASLFNLGAFFVGTALTHVGSAHIPVALPFKELVGHSVSMVLSPLSTGIGSTHGIVLYTRRAVSNGLIRRRCTCKLQGAISAGAIAIWIPPQFTCFILRNPLGWQQVQEGTPIASGDILKRLETGDGIDRQSALFVIPRTSRVIDNHYDYLRLSSNSSKSALLLCLLQLLWGAYTGYIQYDPLIRDRGLSSPFLMVFPYTFMNFANLFANLIEGSYSYITILSAQGDRRESASSTQPFPVAVSSAPTSHDRNIGSNNIPLEHTGVPQGLPIDNSRFRQDSADSEREDRDVSNTTRFADWLALHYPGIKFDEVSSLENWTFMTHHLSSTMVLLFWIGLLTGFRRNSDPSQWFILLAVFLDPVLPVIVTALLRLYPPRNDFVRQAVLGGERIICWSFYIGGWLVAFKDLYSVYSGIDFPSLVLIGTGT